MLVIIGGSSLHDATMVKVGGQELCHISLP